MCIRDSSVAVPLIATALVTVTIPVVLPPIKDSAAAALAHGAPLLRPGIINIKSDVKAGKQVMIETLKGEAVGIVTLTLSTNEIATINEGEVARPSMVLLDERLYPRRWKSPE